jgi:hypothetical protein
MNHGNETQGFHRRRVRRRLGAKGDLGTEDGGELL